MARALEAVRRSLGPDAVILETRPASGGPGRTGVEVLAATDRHPDSLGALSGRADLAWREAASAPLAGPTEGPASDPAHARPASHPRPRPAPRPQDPPASSRGAGPALPPSTRAMKPELPAPAVRPVSFPREERAEGASSRKEAQA